MGWDLKSNRKNKNLVFVLSRSKCWITLWSKGKNTIVEKILLKYVCVLAERKLYIYSPRIDFFANQKNLIRSKLSKNNGDSNPLRIVLMSMGGCAKYKWKIHLLWTEKVVKINFFPTLYLQEIFAVITDFY